MSAFLSTLLAPLPLAPVPLTIDDTLELGLAPKEEGTTPSAFLALSMIAPLLGDTRVGEGTNPAFALELRINEGCSD